MAGPVARPASRLTPYSETQMVRQRRLWGTLVAMLTLATGCSGCAVSGHLGSLFGSGDDASAKAEVTGSIRDPKKDARAEVLSSLPPDADLAFAKAAVAEVLAKGGKDMSAPWENPRSGAHGTVTPIAVAYSHQGTTCRDFLASHINGARTEAWLQGEACKDGKGRWDVRTLKPWKRS